VTIDLQHFQPWIHSQEYLLIRKGRKDVFHIK
jgi:hypothetical protein